MLLNQVKKMSIVVILLAVTTTGFAQNKVVVVPLGEKAATTNFYGRAPGSSDLALLFEWPDTGVEIRTRDVSEGDFAYNLRIINTNAPGGPSFYVSVAGSSASNLGPGASLKLGGLSGVSVLLTENKGTLGRMMRLDCFANVISAGDDGFIQCMGIPAGSP